MPLVEIDETELQQSTSARRFLETLMRNPKARRKVLEAQKEVKPDDPMLKELEQPDPVEELRASYSKELSELKKELAEKEAKREQDEKLSSLKRIEDDGIAKLKSEGWTEDGIKSVKEIMDKKGIMDPLDAAAIYEKAHPPATPVMPNQYGGWNFAEMPKDDNDDLKKLIESRGESNQLIDKIAGDALRDVRGQSRR